MRSAVPQSICIATLLFPPACLAQGSEERTLSPWYPLIAVSVLLVIGVILWLMSRALRACPLCRQPVSTLAHAPEAKRQAILAHFADRDPPVEPDAVRVCRHCGTVFGDHAQRDNDGDMDYRCFHCEGAMAAPDAIIFNRDQRRHNQLRGSRLGLHKRPKGILICVECGAIHGWESPTEGGLDYLSQLTEPDTTE